MPTLASEGAPCDFLGPSGCTFPRDLMPVGCVAFICPYMETWYPAEDLAELRAGVAELQQAYLALRAVLLDEGRSG